MVFVQSTFRVTRFARDMPLSVGGELGAGGSLSYPIPGIAPGGSGYVNIGIPGTGGPFDIYPGFPGYPGAPGAGVNPQIVKVSIPRPVCPGTAITIYMWFAASYGPRQYALRTEMPEIGYNHTTPYIFVSGPGVYQLQNSFTLPVDAVIGDIQGTLKLLTNEQGTTNITIADDEPFVLKVQECGTTPPVEECPPGATKVNNVCTCTDVTKEIWHNLCVTKCPTGYTRDATTGVCELNTCPEGQHRDASTGQCVPDVPTCPTGQHLEGNVCVPDTVTCPAGQHEDNGVCVPDTVPPPTTIPPICESIENPILKQICIQIAGSTCATDDTDEAESFREFCESMSNESCRNLCKRIFRISDPHDDDDNDYPPHPYPTPTPKPPKTCSSAWIEKLCSRYDDNPRAYSRCKQLLNYQCKTNRSGGGGSSGGGGGSSATATAGGGAHASAGGGGATATAGGVTARAGLARSYHPYGGYGRWSY